MPPKRERRPGSRAGGAPPRTTPARSLVLPPALAAVLLFLFAFGVRLLHLAQIADAPFFTIVMGDSKSYDTWAQQIAAGDWIGTEVFYQAPLYPYMLGAIYSVVGHSLTAVRVVQMLLGSIAVVLLADATSRLFSRRAGMVAGILLALYPAAIFFDGLIQKTALDAFLTCVVLWIVTRLIVAGFSWRRWTALGITVGALSLTRENALVFVPLLLFWCLWPAATPSSDDTPRQSRMTCAAAFVAGLALLLLPVAARNAAVGGGFYLTTSQFGPNLYLGNNARTDGTAGALIAGRGTAEYERQDAVDLAERAAGRTLTPAEVSSYWTGQAIAFIKAEPARWLRLMARKTALLWNAAEAFDTESQESYAEYSAVIRWLQPVAHFGVLVPLAFFGAWITWGDRHRLWIYYAIVAVYGASVVLFFIYARYRFPLVPFLLMFTAAGLVAALAYLRRIERPRLIPLAAAIVILVAFTNWPLLATSDSRAVTEHNVGAALQSDGQLDAAIARYRRAVSIDPQYVPAYSNMGAALLARGDLAGAIDAYQRALAIAPDFADAHFNLGNALLRNGNPAGAIPHFERVVATGPDSADVRTNLGIALLESRQLDRALTELRRAVELSPRAPEPRRVLADALAEAKQPQEALVQYQQAAALAPNDGEPQHALGRFLLAEGRTSEAITALRRAVQLTSSASEVHNDLGIALGTSGQREAAIAEFSEALRLDPSNTEARQNLEVTRRRR